MQIVLKTIFFYFFIVVIYRIMGKREIGQLGIVDIIISVLIAELVAISIENYNDSIFITVIPIIILVLLEIILAYLSMKSVKVRTYLEGKPSLIICDGIINYKEMIKQRYSLDDLLLHLRQKEIKSIEEVEYAFLENNGKLSVFNYNRYKSKSSFPMPIIIDGKIQDNSLKKISQNKKWIMREINQNNIDLENIFYAFYKNKRLFIIKKDNNI